MPAEQESFGSWLSRIVTGRRPLVSMGVSRAAQLCTRDIFHGPNGPPAAFATAKFRRCLALDYPYDKTVPHTVIDNPDGGKKQLQNMPPPSTPPGSAELSSPND